MNRNENKNRVKDIDLQKDKQIDEKGAKVDEKISKNYLLVFARDAILDKLLWIGYIITAQQFYVKVNFRACTVALDEYERSLKKNYETSKRMQT